MSLLTIRNDVTKEINMRVHEGQARSLNNEQFQEVIDYTLANSRYPLRDTALLAVSYCCGLRVMEIAELDLDDILNSEGELRQNVTLRKIATKRAKGGVAYFSSPMLRELLSKYLVEVRSLKSTDTRAVFISKHLKRFSKSSLSRHFGTLYKKAGYEGCMGYTGRRSLGRNLNRSGVSVFNIQKILRHTDIKTTQRYIDVDEDMLANLVSGV
mgnify:CR=1 FL=1|jgi:integrase/recombinase XerD